MLAAMDSCFVLFRVLTLEASMGGVRYPPPLDFLASNLNALTHFYKTFVDISKN